MKTEPRHEASGRDVWEDALEHEPKGVGAFGHQGVPRRGPHEVVSVGKKATADVIGLACLVAGVR